MSVDQCSNMFAEWWQRDGWPANPQCAEYTLAREAFRQGWCAAQSADAHPATVQQAKGAMRKFTRDEACGAMDAMGLG